MSTTVTLATVSRKAGEMKRAKESKKEPFFDCISYNFKGHCNRLDELYCKNGKCSWYLTHDGIFAKKRAELGATKLDS